MSFNIKSAKAACIKLDRSDWNDMPAKVQVGEMPSFPLARAIKMPKGTDFPLGSLAMRLKDLAVVADDGFVPTVESVSADAGRVYVSLRFTEATISGTHALEGKQVWDTNLDGAGTGLTFDENGRVRHPGGADTNKNPTWITTANAQRDKLVDEGGNGVTLVDTYTQHRAAFNDVMTEDAGYAFQIEWGTPSITAMADHTNGCITEATKTINDKTKYENGNTYNENSALQQLSLLTNLAGMPGAKKDGKPVPSSPYQKAAAATASFNGSVLSNTKVKKVNEIPGHTSEGVYDIVKTGKPAPEVSVDQVHKLLNGEEIGGRCADEKAWSMMLDEDQRVFVRDIQARQQMHIERVAAAKPVTLVNGAAHANLNEFHLYIEFKIAEDGSACFADARVELDSFDLELEDNEWPVGVGAIAREELGKARFIKSLLHDRVADALERDLAGIVTTVLKKALEHR